MKKIRFVLPILVIAFVLVSFGRAILSETAFILRFDEIYLVSGTAPEPPAKAAAKISIVKEGTYIGFSDVPVSEEQGRSYQEVFAALREQQYKKIPSSISPASGGISIETIAGCSPTILFYWDGSALWVYSTQDGWTGYAPSSPKILGAVFNTICNS